MKRNTFDISGLFHIETIPFVDERGIFVKTFHQEIFEEFKIENNFKEEYYSISHKNVLRGMHFQLPPYDHAKMVYCTRGRIIDVALDLRKHSGTFGKYKIIELSEGSGVVFIPRGFAHGFLSIEESSTVCYKVETIYNKEHDSGILWNSFGLNWPSLNPILSNRDKNFIHFKNFESPF